ncbi:C-type lectin-like [Notechis scutatus]|uniref:C-type lectin-like n=1 Tax=Notechis scutatus TaxID=8663 RepID=A0A6J1VJI9_9SAUR|nr:C-type lectin-like [Notechis scutatus]
MGLFTYFSLCFLGLLIANPFLEAEADTCAREWLQNQGNCYAYFDHKLTWQEAEIECQSYGRGAHLTSILTKAETLLVAEHISTYQQELSNVWIGLQDVRQTGKWRWADESTYNYKAWMKSQPDNYGNAEHCVELRLSTGFKEWNDSPCQKLNAYICKHEL